MVVVNYKLMINGNVARAEDLYLTSVTAAKRLLSRKIPGTLAPDSHREMGRMCRELDTEICHRRRRDISPLSLGRLRRGTGRSDSDTRYRWMCR